MRARSPFINVHNDLHGIALFRCIRPPVLFPWSACVTGFANTRMYTRFSLCQVLWNHNNYIVNQYIRTPHQYNVINHIQRCTNIKYSIIRRSPNKKDMTIVQHLVAAQKQYNHDNYISVRHLTVCFKVFHWFFWSTAKLHFTTPGSQWIEIRRGPTIFYSLCTSAPLIPW